MKWEPTPRKVNILLTACIYVSLVGAAVSLYLKWIPWVWVFLTTGLLFLLLRSASYITEKLGQINFYKQD